MHDSITAARQIAAVRHTVTVGVAGIIVIGAAVTVVATTVSVAVVRVIERTGIAFVRLTVAVVVRVTSIAVPVLVTVTLITICALWAVVYYTTHAVPIGVLAEVSGARRKL